VTEPFFSDADLRRGLTLSNALLNWLDHQPQVTLHEVAVAMLVVMVELGRRLEGAGINGPAVVELLAHQAGAAVRESVGEGPVESEGPVH
jgi:hypothetical protein